MPKKTAARLGVRVAVPADITGILSLISRAYPGIENYSAGQIRGQLKGGSSVDVIQTDIGPIGVLICYESEFPELGGRLVDEGARIIFVPFCTDNRQGYMRVRYCAQARAIENQCFVVLSGNVGNLPGVDNMDVQYAQSCILTPCDFPFARDGIAAEASERLGRHPSSVYRERQGARPAGSQWQAGT
jgi:predicted amidohydrolase